MLFVLPIYILKALTNITGITRCKTEPTEFVSGKPLLNVFDLNTLHNVKLEAEFYTGYVEMPLVTC